MRSHARGQLFCLALLSFFLLGGGTAFAAYVVSSNSQIGPGTVSGHNPPAGAHANLIQASIAASDLAPAVRLPQGCGSGKVPKATGSNTWLCGATTPVGAAGGALAGSYPNPKLNVQGGPCPNGRALTNVSAMAVLTCGPGVYSDAFNNVAAGPSGFPALTNVHDDASNSALGSKALRGLRSGTFNSAVGATALSVNRSGNANSALGARALAASDGDSNSAVGAEALEANTSGGGNSAVGADALQSNTEGGVNSAFGRGALHDNTVGDANAAVGIDALAGNTEGSGNSAVGPQALFGNSTGNENSALGNQALGSNESGDHNVAVGVGALVNNHTGSQNTALGEGAGHGVTGSRNTTLGTLAGFDLTTGSNNIDVNNTGVAADSGITRIGTEGTQTKAFMAGISGTITDGAASPVVVDGNGQLGTTSSSRRVKTDIRPLRSAARRVMRLRPVSFHYKRQVQAAGSGAPRQYGLIAEQVKRIYPSLVVDGSDGRPSAVAYQELPALLLAQVQSQQRRISRLARQVAHLRRAGGG